MARSAAAVLHRRVHDLVVFHVVAVGAALAGRDELLELVAGGVLEFVTVQALLRRDRPVHHFMFQHGAVAAAARAVFSDDRGLRGRDLLRRQGELLRQCRGRERDETKERPAAKKSRAQRQRRLPFRR